MVNLRSQIGWKWRRPTYPFGATAWKSLAWVRVASNGGGEAALHQASLEDHRNPVALARLGRLQTTDPENPARFADGLEHLELARQSLLERPTVRHRMWRGSPTGPT